MLPPPVRLPILSTTLFIAAFLFTAVLGATETIDNGDDRIHYYGPWTFKHQDDDPQSLNWEGTVSYGDVPNEDACDVYFEGTRIAVYGAFSPPGQYDMQSSYSIDGGPATTFTPNPVVAQSQYRQMFYQSPVLSPGNHVLSITNLGRQFWFDFAQVEVDSPLGDDDSDSAPPSPITTTTIVSDGETTTTVTKNGPSPAAVKHSSTTTTTTASRPPTTSPRTTTSSRSNTTSTATSLNATSTVSKGSTDPISNATLPFGATPTEIQPTSSDVLSSTAVPTIIGAASNVHTPHGLPTAAIAGIAVAGALVLALVLFLAWGLHRKRAAASRARSVAPYDPALAATPESTSFPFDRELKFDIASAGLSREALLPSHTPPYPVQAQAHSPSDESVMVQTPTSGAPLLHASPTPTRALQARNAEAETPRRTGTMSSKSAAAGSRSRKTPSEGPSILVSPPSTGTAATALPAPPRQSQDGGVRLAGGPPGRTMEHLEEPDRTSMLSTLPPSYQYYP